MPFTELKKHARKELKAIVNGQLTRMESARVVMQFIKAEEAKIRQRHNNGADGLEIAAARSILLDIILDVMFKTATGRHEDTLPEVTLVAQGGYGRGHLNPSSDLDLLFLLPRASNKVTKDLSSTIEEILYILWDSGFKVGHACRSIAECISEARKDQQSKTALMDARFISGDKALFKTFKTRFDKECVTKGQEDFLDLRRADLRRRHGKYSHTVFLQEPHVKESCGGLRDYQNILWVARVKEGFTTLQQLVDARIITKSTYRQLNRGYDFLHRVRNELHYDSGRCSDILTLRMQGVVATNFKYPQKSILRRCEAFMRDYYRHTRAIYSHGTSLMEHFEIEYQERSSGGLLGIIPFAGKKKAKTEKFDGFFSRNGRLFLQNPETLEDDPNRLMRLFQHCQIRSLKLSPQARKYIHEASKKIDRAFRYSVDNRETFRAILQRKGEVARILRLMHRTKVLDNYMPEFGAMDCLVQHEFFHRYTADEHTLRCIDQLDSLTDDIDEQDHGRKLYRRLLHNVQDPYALYLALILHDSGRAENVREHIDGSTILADKVCRRLQIRSGRRAMIMFLVDHHLTFWRFATSRNLEDISVIEEFANIMKDKRNLDALLLFTWADSNGTNDEAWSPWKETLMLQLYHATRLWLQKGKDHFKSTLSDDKAKLLERCRKILPASHHEEMMRHFEQMPAAYFRFREPKNIATHIKSIQKFFKRESTSNGAFECDLSWIERNNRSHTELVVSAWNRPLFLEKVCCALASQDVNIIGADVYTRHDGVACDLFQICTPDLEPVTSERTRKRVIETFRSINQDDDPYKDYESAKYLKPKTNLLRDDLTEGGIPFPTRVHISNELSPTCTAIDIQARDRIGLLHDLFLMIGKLGLATVHARICTEKGAAMDTIYVTWPDGGKIEDEEKHREIEAKISKLIG